MVCAVCSPQVNVGREVEEILIKDSSCTTWATVYTKWVDASVGELWYDWIHWKNGDVSRLDYDIDMY